jgi:hypothetical protein
MVLIVLSVFLVPVMSPIIFIVFTIIAFAIAIATAIITGLLYTDVITITKDGLIIRHRGSTTTIPAGVVVGNNLLCIKRVWYGLRGYRLHVVYNDVIYTILLEDWQAYELINMLRAYWGWVPPMC